MSKISPRKKLQNNLIKTERIYAITSVSYPDSGIFLFRIRNRNPDPGSKKRFEILNHHKISQNIKLKQCFGSA